ncbi:MAG TPA: SIMPL domain-containing protein [Dictyoglomaceae bacterium]|nr:SIMPL domain-containing protein [Dictyoglomaceae bacterium]HOP95547.1 SIMPL domain-containing protein [Dictyoglomaceae bacterium]HPP16349.1 SIMPL domain-containing protein [Dictyoglomaceae bacterium]HPU43419.1 SIMPL domain-containing protein [Dictyoglomaceae bacterium]
MKNNLWAIIIGLCLIISAFIVSNTFYSIKALDNTLSVTGSARIKVNSDIVRWIGTFSRTVPEEDLKNGYRKMSNDLNLVLEFYKKNGIDTKDLIISPVSVEQPWFYSDRQVPKECILRQTVEIQSHDLEKITTLAKNFQELLDKGVNFSTQSLEYYYSKLPDLRVDLLTEAMNDAKARAEKIAQSSGQKVGSLKSASMGVVQVLAPNSTEVTDYGSYNTVTIDKEVMVTVRATFLLK